MSKVIKVGSYLPENILSNDDLIDNYQLDSNHEWIQKRTGICARHFAKKNQEVADLAIFAAKDIVGQMGEDISKQLKLIIVASMSSKQPTPTVANQVSQALACADAFCLDINTACSGFVTALELAAHLSTKYRSGFALVIGSEKMSQLLDFTDRSSCILFGDGAGGFLIKLDGRPLEGYQSAMHSVNDEQLSIEVSQATHHVLKMKGREVFNFVSRQVIPSLGSFVASIQEEYDFIICHQANQRFLELIAKRLKVPSSLIPSNIESVANLSAASIPVLCHQLVQNQQLKLDGSQRIVLCGFGAGLSWGNITLTL